MSNAGEAPSPATQTVESLRPFIKWAGGKQGLVPRLVTLFPQTYDRYFEPFLGGASVFLACRPPRAVLADHNRWLVDTYRAVRWRWRSVVTELQALRNTKTDYLEVRARDPWGVGLAARAAQFIYLNKTCFRGLFRVNRAGGFNVPYGAYDRRTHDPDQLRDVARALRGVELRFGDFETGLRGITKKDFAYLDPPYVKLGGHSDFNRYTETQFREDDHRRLADLCRHLAGRGIRWLLSQSDTDAVRSLFDGFPMKRIDARREINLDSRQRDVGELLIRSA